MENKIRWKNSVLDFTSPQKLLPAKCCHCPQISRRKGPVEQAELQNKLQNIRGQFSQLGTLALLQLNMRTDRFTPELADNIIKTVRGRIHIGIVDLIGIACEDDFGAVANPRDD